MEEIIENAKKEYSKIYKRNGHKRKQRKPFVYYECEKCGTVLQVPNVEDKENTARMKRHFLTQFCIKRNVLNTQFSKSLSTSLALPPIITDANRAIPQA